MAYLQAGVSPPFKFDPDANADKGVELSAAYAAAEPFPHVAIDDFLPPAILDYCLAHFPSGTDPDGRVFDRAQERGNASFNPDYLTPELASLFYAFNTRPFVRFLENLTGLKGLIPDPYFLGAGFHEVRQGGNLSVHADFNHHQRMDLERRLNVLIYLNEDWRPDYGGQLELWDREMKTAVRIIDPVFNRAVVFTTTSESWHGNPRPVAHPDGVSRRSIALYYYTATWNEASSAKTKQFRVRPDSDDKADRRVKSEELITEYFPPFMARRLVRLARRF
ncbi:MAG: 2OG-Fe(II) oxygenase [Parvularculaceae bacterium]